MSLYTRGSAGGMRGSLYEAELLSSSEHSVSGGQSSLTRQGQLSGSRRHASGATGTSGVSHSSRRHQRAVVQVATEVRSAPFVLPYVDGVCSLPVARRREALRHFRHAPQSALPC